MRPKIVFRHHVGKVMTVPASFLMPRLRFGAVIINVLFWSHASGLDVTTIICGTIKSTDAFVVDIYEPVNGYFNLSFFNKTNETGDIMKRADSFHTIINLSVPSFVTVYVTTPQNQFVTRSDLLLIPGDSVNLALNPDADNTLTYSGSNWLGQRLFNIINYEPYEKFRPVFDLLDSLSARKGKVVQSLDAIVANLTEPFDLLLKNGQITMQFKKYIDFTFRGAIYYQFITKILSGAKATGALTRPERDSIVEALFKKFPPDRVELRPLYISELYLNCYYDFLTYKKFCLPSLNKFFPSEQVYTVNKSKYLIESDFVQYIYIDNKQDQIDLWALRILLFYNYPGKYSLELAKQFDSIFPENKWSTILQEQYYTKGAKLPPKIEYSLLSPIQYIDAPGIKSMSQLFKKIPNENIFLDLWATWCMPCIAAFGYNRQLDSFLIQEEISKLYISFDSGESSEKWKEAINKYALGGYHIIANENLIRDIQLRVYHQKRNTGMGIPRYVLIKNGVIIIDNAYSPAEIDLLKKQIREALGIEAIK